jgi:DNA-binding response OmpR family regulator
MRLLAVEDHQELLASIVELLSDEYDVDQAADGEEGLYLAMQGIYDAIILDVMLPGLDGFEVVRRLREANIDTPVLFLTAKDALDDRVKGLDLGGDDYLVKPFQGAELKARLRALLRRSGALTTKQTVRYRGIELFGREREILVDGHPVKLTAKQYDLLEYLIHNKNVILTKEQILDRVWGFDMDTTLAIVEVYIHQLRKKLEPFGYHTDIKTVRGVGYMLSEH